MPILVPKLRLFRSSPATRDTPCRSPPARAERWGLEWLYNTIALQSTSTKESMLMHEIINFILPNRYQVAFFVWLGVVAIRDEIRRKRV